MSGPALLLETRGLTKDFRGFTAVKSVDLRINAGSVHALVGPNGAGKTTLFNCLCGTDRADKGEVSFDATDITGWRPDRVASRGIGRTFQQSLIFEEMSLLENVMVGRRAARRTGLISDAFSLPASRLAEKDASEKAFDVLRFIGIEERAGESAGNLPQGDRHLLEIARALAGEPMLLLLDEPAAGLNSAETEGLCSLIRRIRDDGVTVLLVEHDMRLVQEISDEVVVLDTGRKIAEGPPRLILEDDAVIAAYLGSDES